MNTSQQESASAVGSGGVRHSVFSSLKFTAYDPRWLPRGHDSSMKPSRSLLDHVVGGDDSTLVQLQKLAAMGYDATAVKSGVAWWSGVSPSGAVSSQGAPPATDYNRLLGLEQTPR